MRATFILDITHLLLSSILVMGFECAAQQSESGADKEQPYSFSLTTKIHSTGHSPFSGTYLNHHLNADFGLSFRYRQLGAFMNKIVDFANMHSAVNYTTVGIYNSFQLGESVKLSPYVGYFLKQSHSFIDDNSDAWTAVVVRVTITRWLALENSTLVGNLIRHHSNTSLANRMNAIISIGKFKLDAYAWYTNSLKSEYYFMSGSLALTSPDWVISKSVSARVQVAFMQQISPLRPEGTMHRGGLVSLIVPVDLSINDGERSSSDN